MTIRLTRTGSATANADAYGANPWLHLEYRTAPWRPERRYVKGHRLRPVNIWQYLGGREPHSVEEAMDNWDLPREAVEECIFYCDSHLDEIERDATEERSYLESKGIQIEPPPARE